MMMTKINEVISENFLQRLSILKNVKLIIIMVLIILIVPVGVYADGEPPVIDAETWSCSWESDGDDYYTIDLYVDAEDPDTPEEDLIFTASNLPSGADFTDYGGCGTFEWTPDYSQGDCPYRLYTVTFRVEDPEGNFDEENCEIEVYNISMIIMDSASGYHADEVGNVTVNSGQSFNVYSWGDACLGLEDIVAADWSLINKTGGVVNGDLVSAGDNKSASFTGHSAGTAVIRAEIINGGGEACDYDVTGTITVVGGYKVDNQIRNSGEGSYIGDNIYNLDGTNQTKAQNVDNGITAIYHIRIQNDGNIADTFTVTGAAGDANWTVTYYDALSAGTNITGSITGGGWSTGSLASGGAKEIRVEVTPGAGAGGGTSRVVLVTSTSQGDPGKKDAVKAITTVNSAYLTDNQIRNSGEGSYIGDNIYNLDGTNQTKAQNVNNSQTAIYHIKVENDGNTSDTCTVSGSGGDANWTVTYYDALVSGNNITDSVTGSGWFTGALISGGTREIRVEVTPGAGAGGGTSREILITSILQGDTGKKDAVKANIACNSLVNEVSCSLADIVPEFIVLKREAALLKISISVAEHDAVWEGLRITKNGTIQDINVVAVRVYRDNGNQEFDRNDILIGEGTFVRGETDIRIIPQSINTAIKSYFVTCEIGANAGIGTTIGVECDPTVFSIVAPDVMASDLYCFDTKTAMIVEVIVSKTVLHPNYPNPFCPGKDRITTIQYDLLEDVSSIEIEIYTLAGDLVRKWSGNTRRGRHKIFWDATNQGGRMVSSGMYFIIIKKDGKVISRKRMVIIK